MLLLAALVVPNNVGRGVTLSLGDKQTLEAWTRAGVFFLRTAPKAQIVAIDIHGAKPRGLLFYS